MQLGHVRSSHQLRGSVLDNHDGTGLRRNPKGPLQNGPLQNAQPSKDVSNLCSKHRRQSWGLGGRNPRFWVGGSWGVAKHYY